MKLYKQCSKVVVVCLGYLTSHLVIWLVSYMMDHLSSYILALISVREPTYTLFRLIYYRDKVKNK